MAKLIFNYIVGNNKQNNAQQKLSEYTQKGKNVLFLKPNDTNLEKSNTLVFDKTENLKTIFENEEKKFDVVIVDNSHLCTKKQIDELREISEIVPVLCYGQKTNFQNTLFEGSKRLIEISDELKEIKNTCKCGKKAIVNGLFVNGLLVSDSNENTTTRPLCWDCYKKEQFKARIYDKLIKYLNIFKNKETVGKWSSDTSIDNIILQKPFVIYDEETQAFMNDFREFKIKNPEQTLVINDNAKDLREISMRGKSYDYVMTLISYVIKMENTHPGLLKTLIEDGTIVKWLSRIKKVVD